MYCNCSCNIQLVLQSFAIRYINMCLIPVSMVIESVAKWSWNKEENLFMFDGMSLQEKGKIEGAPTTIIVYLGIH